MTMTLSEAIKAVAPHVTKDKTLPILTQVRVVNGRVYATDRFTLAIVTLPEEILDPSIEALLSPEDIKAGIVNITTEDGGESATLTLANGGYKTAVSLSSFGGTDYPDLVKLAEKITPSDDAAGITSLGVNIDYLLRFHGKNLPKIGRSVKTPRFTFGVANTKPVMVTFLNTPEYVGYIVPIREGF